MDPLHPQVALGGGRTLPLLAPCVHYAGNEKFLQKALLLQQERGPVFDIAADCEDGAPMGGEREHAEMIARTIGSAHNVHSRVGARTHGVRHAAWREELDILLRDAGERIAFLTVPKSESVGEVVQYLDAVAMIVAHTGIGREIPVSVLVETPGAVHDAWAIAALPGIVSLDFGTLDFVSSHHGAVPFAAMRSPGQFDHALMRRAKAETAAAALAHGIVPTHGICQGVDDDDEVYGDARRARDEFGFLRMWSIHPNQIGPIVFAMQPDHDAIVEATAVLIAGRAAHWAPTARMGRMHDRASYRYFWNVLQRAHAAGAPLPVDAQALFTSPQRQAS
ncbi:MAG: aldolase/citrate lyase family protein [Pseudomonadota bacterium]|nr:aldolase/citrate lyase family protein [Pseudomonadota bacterium]